MSCVVDGTIPPSSGLSSSSALVCCAGLVTMEANQKSLSKVINKVFLILIQKRGTPNFRINCNLTTFLPVVNIREYLSLSNSLFSPFLIIFCDPPGGTGWDMCQKWALHWHRGRRHGPVHLIPGRERNCTSLSFQYIWSNKWYKLIRVIFHPKY